MYLGIDIGGTTARISVFASLNDVAEYGRQEFPVGTSFEDDMTRLAVICKRLSVEYSDEIEGVGLAVAGKVNPLRSHLTGAGNLSHWVGEPIEHMLETQLDCRVVLGNDAEAAALAEALYGRGREDDFWFVIWGTGVGGCLVRHINGNPVALPGELGHQQVKPNSSLVCGCGQKGCLEAFAGGAGIENRLSMPAKDLTPEHWDEVLGWMTIGVHNVVAAQPVPLVVFGGGVANKQQHLLKGLGVLLWQSLRVVDAPRVELSAFGESAGTIGALALLGMQ
jgi:glucokinase